LRPDYLIIGHIAKDNTPNGPMLGGTCSYSALTAQRLGRQVGAVTSYGPDIPSLNQLKGVELVVAPAAQSTTFENYYIEGMRCQKWLASSAPLAYIMVPLAWRAAPIVHLAPLVQEIPPALCADFSASLVCATGQGWLRGQDEFNNVIYQPHPDLGTWLSSLDILVLSLADVFGERAILIRLLTSAKLGVETLGPEGCRIYHQGRVSYIPVQPEVEVDSTGAGDIFAAAFFIRYDATVDPIQAAQFANACASLSVKKQGMDSIPNLGQVETHQMELYG
jgi:hypothetical protein